MEIHSTIKGCLKPKYKKCDNLYTNPDYKYYSSTSKLFYTTSDLADAADTKDCNTFCGKDIA